MRIPALLLFFALTLKSADRLTATGLIVDETNQPIGGATVMVYSAAVKTGYDQFCPTCYVDCGKRAITDDNGTFTISGLSAGLVFNLLVIREGYGSVFVKKLDPSSGAAPATMLKKRILPEDVAQSVRGRAVDAKGNPVHDALVSQQGLITERSTQFGDTGWLDSIAVTNRDGEFEMAHSKPAKAMIVQVAPRGMAPKLAILSTGATRHSVTLTDGATIRGRLLHDGKPLTNAEMVLSSHSRMSGKYYPGVRIGTNEKGEFAITNVPAGRVWDLNAVMDPLAPRNLAAAITYVETKDDGQEIDLGDIAARAAHTLRGRIVLSDGSPIPSGMQVSIFLDGRNERQSLPLPAGGAFEFKGLVEGVYVLSPAVRGYQAQDPTMPQEILIESDRNDLVVTLAPSPRPVK